MATINITNKLVGVEARQENDYYATPPVAFDVLQQHISLNQYIWECACGGKHLSNRMVELGYVVRSSDLIQYGHNEVLDFLKYDGLTEGDIITNPPFKHMLEFAKTALSALRKGNKLCLLVKIQFLESAKRYKFLNDNMPCDVLVFAKRLTLAKNGDFEKYKVSGSAMCLAWMVWQKGYTGITRLQIVHGE